jgi:predicted nucleic acid-binding protein
MSSTFVMPTRSSKPDALLDTSVAVALSVADHVHHEAVTRALRGRRLGLAGHAAFETFSVMTRLPGPARRAPAVVAQLLAANFPASRFLSANGARAVLDSLAASEISGGAVYDALVGAAAREHQVTLVTLDRRALETYRAVGVDVELIANT